MYTSGLFLLIHIVFVYEWKGMNLAEGGRTRAGRLIGLNNPLPDRAYLSLRQFSS